MRTIAQFVKLPSFLPISQFLSVRGGGGLNDFELFYEAFALKLYSADNPAVSARHFIAGKVSKLNYFCTMQPKL